MVTALAYAARVCALRICAVKNSTIRSAAAGPARWMIAGRPSTAQSPGRVRAVVAGSSSWVVDKSGAGTGGRSGGAVARNATRTGNTA